MHVWDKVKLKVNVKTYYNFLQVFRHQIHMYVMLSLAYVGTLELLQALNGITSGFHLGNSRNEQM